MPDKLPPHDIAVEESVLGALLIDSEAITLVAGSLKPDDFYREKNVWVYEACCDIYNRNEPVDQITVAHELANSNRLDACGGAAYLSHLIASCATSVHIEYYADILKKLASRRALLKAAAQIEALVDEEDTDKAYGDAVGILLELKRDSKSDYVMTPQDQAEYAMERYAKKMNSVDDTTIPFGLKCLEPLGGMEGGDIVIIAGPTSEGKTTLARQITGFVAKNYGPVLFVSLEMSKGQLTDRDIARSTDEHIVKVRRGHYTEEFYDRICASYGVIAKSGVHYCYPPRGTVPRIYATARKTQLRYGLRLVVIDYIQLMRDIDGGRSMDEKFTNISQGVKEMARDLDVPIIAVSRLSRNKDQSNIDRNYGSGAFSYDPDWAFYLEREKDDTGKYTDVNNLIITKMRQGGVKDAEQKLIFTSKSQSFSEMKE